MSSTSSFRSISAREVASICPFQQLSLAIQPIPPGQGLGTGRTEESFGPSIASKFFIALFGYSLCSSMPQLVVVAHFSAGEELYSLLVVDSSSLSGYQSCGWLWAA